MMKCFVLFNGNCVQKGGVYFGMQSELVLKRYLAFSVMEHRAINELSFLLVAYQTPKQEF